MIFGHQFIGQLDEDTRKTIFGNVGSILVLRRGPEDAKYLVSQFEPTFDEYDLVNFDNYNGALRLLIKGETSKPFKIITFPPGQGNPESLALSKNTPKLNRVEIALWWKRNFTKDYKKAFSKQAKEFLENNLNDFQASI